MDKEFFESQINQRRRGDEEMFRGAFADLLSVIGINAKKASVRAKGAIADILKYLGNEVPEVPDSITDLNEQMEYMLRPSHTMHRRVELMGEWWKESFGCYLGSTKDGDVIAILPGTWAGYYYIDKDGKKIKINKQTVKNLNIDAFCFYKAFPLKSLKIIDLVKFIIKSMPPVDVFYMLLFAGVAQMFALLGPEIQKIIYDKIIPSGSTSLIFPIASFMFGITFGNILIEITRQLVTARFGTKFGLAVSSAVMIRFFSLPTKFFKQYTAGELATRVGYISQLCQTIKETIFSVGITTLFSFTYIFQMGRYAPSLVVPGIIIVFINLGFGTFMTLYQQQYNKKKLELEPKLQSLTYAIFGGIQKIKVTGSEKRAFAKWADIFSEVEKFTYSPPMLIRINSIISLIVSTIGTMVIYYFAITSKVPYADYNAFNTAYGGVSGAISTIYGVALQFATIQPILKLIKPVMEEKPESSEGRKIPTKLYGDIEINDVTFKYDKDGPQVLKGINLKIKRGEYIGIVGKTGCGKSTLLRLLLGFEVPDTGAIYYDGRDLKTLDLRSVRQKIGVVMQNGSLFPNDIFSNIIITSPWKTMDDAWEAAKFAGIDEDIKAMPMGMHTLISEGSGGLSGGQKQRLMIARAIINRPKVLFLDEATSALDNITQKHVADKLSEIEGTKVVIAHRLSTIKSCDRILVMDKGTIVEEGKYDDLMAKKGMFYDLAIRQIVGEKGFNFD